MVFLHIAIDHENQHRNTLLKFSGFHVSVEIAAASYVLSTHWHDYITQVVDEFSRLAK